MVSVFVLDVFFFLLICFKYVLFSLNVIVFWSTENIFHGLRFFLNFELVFILCF